MLDPSILALLVLLAACLTLAAVAFVLWRGRNSGEPHAVVIAELARVQTDTAARLEALMGHFTNTQSQLQRSVNERFDSLTYRLGESFFYNDTETTENLQKLNERLAV